jgi:hypothetical protein
MKVECTRCDDVRCSYDTRPLEGNHFRYEVATGVWCLVTPDSGASKPRGYASNGAQPLTHERPETEAKSNPFDLVRRSS